MKIINYLKMIKIEKKEINTRCLFKTKIPSKSDKLILFKCIPLEKKLLQKKIFRIRKKKFNKNKKTINNSNRNGFWFKCEHNKFIEALYLYNCNWLKMQLYIKDRTYSQIRSHAQKFYIKLKSFKDDELGVDFTSLHIKSLKDIVNIVKDKELISKNYRNLLYIISDKISFGKDPFKKKIKQINYVNKQVNINNNFLKNINYIDNNNKNFNKITLENFLENNEQLEELTLNSYEYDKILSIIQESEGDIDNIVNLNDNNIFISNNIKEMF